MSHLKEIVGYKKPRKLNCPKCGNPTQVRETRFEYRVRKCYNGHIHYTFQDTFTTEADFVAARAMRDLRKWNVTPRLPKPPKPPKDKIPYIETLPKIRTGHHVEVTETGRVYRMI